MYADAGVQRYDGAHLVTDRITTDLPSLAREVAKSTAENVGAGTGGSGMAEAQVVHLQANICSMSLATSLHRVAIVSMTCLGHCCGYAHVHKIRRLLCTSMFGNMFLSEGTVA